ncbi:Hypothetical predicted protein [Paramuricea clavata]|uniref:Uncharacterized protein n=1 Tax=Paramuricea clavata TaxID=317549 RepID=A0A6S7IPX1_PARCT|nr:Hypothetical predicted protein [Paramuricea clavata]
MVISAFNHCLEAGPSLHNDLPGILMRFREKPVALTGDVSDMFCYVRLEPEDCKYHRYLLRGLDMSRPPDESSHWVANYAVTRTTKEWPVAAAVVKRNIFVDDLYTSYYDDDDEAITLRKDVTNLMAKGGFPMRMWLSSLRKDLETIPEEERAAPNKNWDEQLPPEEIVFCDASEITYAAAAFIRARSTDGDYVCHLIMSKTRLMPLKAVSIPCGELMACQLSVRLAKSVRKQLGLNNCRVKYVSDSTTALWWIKSEPRKFRPFVANRVAEILSESDLTQWHHIGTKLNIADIASRGTSVADISADSTWIQGPDLSLSSLSGLLTKLLLIF